MTREDVPRTRAGGHGGTARDTGDGTSDWVWETDAEARYTASNSAAERLLGRPLSCVLGRRVDEVLSPADPGTRDLLDAHRDPRPLLVSQNEVMDATGASRSLSTVGFAVFDRGRGFCGYHGVHRDRGTEPRAVEGDSPDGDPRTLVYRRMPIPTYVWRRVGEDFLLIECNEAAAAITRGGSARFLGARAGEMYVDRPGVVAFLERCWRTRWRDQEEMTYRMLSTGEERVFIVTGDFLPPDLVVVHTEDVTASRRAEGALREARDRLERVLDAVEESILILDERRGIISWNRRAAELLAAAPDTLRGRDFPSFCHPAEAPRVTAGLDPTNPTPVPCSAIRLLRGDGRDVQAQMAATAVVCTEEGTHLGWVVALRDLSGEERAARELRETRDLNRKILEAAPVWIDVLDAEGRILLWNREAEKISGYTSEEVLGRKDLWDFLYPDPAYREEMHRRVHGRRRPLEAFRGLESTIRTKSGEERIISWQGQTLDDEEGRVGGVVAIGHDVTEMKRSEQSLREYATQVAHLSRERSRFLSTASHELRTPLAALRGWAELLTRDEGLSEHGRERVERILVQADRLDSLVGDLLSLARLDGPGAGLDRRPIDLRSILDRVIRTLGPGLDSKRHALSLPSDESPVEVQGDEDAVEMILTNLLANAIVYTPAGGRIAVRFIALGESVRVDVSDTGIGVDAEDRDRLFEEFYRSDRAKRVAPDGTGLGLAIVKRLIEQMGGAVWATSPGGDGGSTF